MGASDWLSVGEVADYLGFDVSRVRALCAAGQIPSKTWGVGLRVPRAAFEQWVETLTDFGIDELLSPLEPETLTATMIKSRVSQANANRRRIARHSSGPKPDKPPLAPSPPAKPAKPPAPRKPKASKPKRQPTDTSVLLTVEEAARRLRIGRTMLYPLLMAGTIDSLKVGSRRVVPVDAIDRYIADSLTDRNRRRRGA